MLKQVFLALLPAFALSLCAATASAQVAIGTYPLGTYDSLGADTINVGNLNVMLDIPVLHKAGRAGTNFTYDLFYNGSVWSGSSSSGGTWSPDANWGWVVDAQPLTGYISETYAPAGSCAAHARSSISITLGNVDYHDRFGVQHSFRGERTYNACTGASTDTLTNTWSQDHQYYYGSGGLSDARGVLVNAPVNTTYGASTYTDTNGNQISTDGSGNFTDTTGNIVLSITGNAPSNKVFTYKDPSGATRNVQISYSNYAIATNFGCAGIAEYSNSSVSLISTITFADNNSYSFTYEHGAGTATGSVTGRLASITLPSGGVISYTYPGSNGGISCSDGSAIGITRTQTSTAGTPSRTYARSSAGSMLSHTSVLDEAGNDTEYDFVQNSSTSALKNAWYETSRTVHTGNSSGPVLMTRQTCYNAVSQPCNTQALSAPIIQTDTYQTLDGVSTSGTTTNYDSFLQVTGVYPYDYGTSGSRGRLLQSEAISYNANEQVISDDISDATGSRLAKYAYDGAPLQATTGIPQHTTVSGSRGNLTEVDQYISPRSNNSYVATQLFQYYDTGSVYSGQSAAGGLTYYTYDGTNTYPTLAMPPSPNGVSLASSASYDPYLGTPVSNTLPTGTTSSVISSDVFGRPTEIDLQSNGTVIAKTTSAITPTQTTTTVFQSSSVSAQTVTSTDLYGRPIRTAAQNGSGWYVTDTCYNALGQVSFKSYPYNVSSLGAQVCSGLGDEMLYDALGRVKTVLHGDTPQTSVTYTYSGAATQKLDENQKTHIYQVDALGRPTITCEISSIALQSDAPVDCGTLITGTGFVTTYTNTLASTTINQGAQTRVFAYDGLGRLTSKTVPETPGVSGGPSVTYSYSFNSTGEVVTRTTPQANQTNPAITTTTTTQYDSLVRPISIIYSDGFTPNKYYSYDVAPSGSGFAAANAQGQLTAAISSNGAQTLYSYDPMGRVHNTSQCVPGWCGTGTPPAFTRTYGYDWAGNPVNEQYSTPAGTVGLTYGVNVAGQLTSVTGGQDNALSSLFSATTLNAYGPTAASLGNGVGEILTYDPFGRQNGLGLTLGSAPLYAYTATWLGQQVTGSSDSVNGTGTYSYDDFHRLQSATITTGSGTLNLGWIYDRYGNRLSQGASGSYPVGVGQPSLSVSTTSNRITSAGYTYDAAGNLMTDGVNTYTYDAEGNLVGVTGGTSATFTFDALNQRVLTVIGGTTRAYGFNLAGQRATVWDGSGNLISAQYYAGGQPFAYYLASDGHVRFQHQDWLGTERFRTTYTGTVEGSFTSLPFGDSTSTASGSDTDAYHYAGLDADTTDLQHATFRQYSDMQGRWLRPDPYDGSYDESDPQTLNRYSYVLDSPQSLTDASGLDHTEYVITKNCIITYYVYTSLAATSTGLVANADAEFAGAICSSSSAGGGSIAIAGGGGGGAPNNGKKSAGECAWEAAKDKGVSIGLDILGAIPVFGNGVSAGAGIVRAGIAVNHAITSPAFAVGSGIYGAYGGVTAGPGEAADSLVGSASAGAGIGLALADVSLEGTKAIPIVGNVVSGLTGLYDGYQAYQKYQACMAGH